MKHEYYSPAQAANLLGVHPESGRRWEREGKITSYRTPSGQRRFLKREIEGLLLIGLPTTTVCYARVSSYSQREDARADNLNTCAFTIQRRSSFLKLEGGLILSGGSSKPFWNELSSRISSGLSLPTATDSADLDGNWLSGYANTMQSNSWFSMNNNSVQSKSLFRICCPSSIASVLGSTVSESTEKKSARKYGKNQFKKSRNVQPNSVRKIPLFPDRELHAIWKQ